jgi:uncharacterized membrane protein YjjP (DUF1212 family)
MSSQPITQPASPLDIQRQIKMVELDIAGYEDGRKKLEREINAYRSAYWLAAIGFFAGLLLLVFGLWYCSVILIPAGALAAITQTLKIRSLQEQIGGYDAAIRNARVYLRTIL